MCKDAGIQSTEYRDPLRKGTPIWLRTACHSPVGVTTGSSIEDKQPPGSFLIHGQPVYSENGLPRAPAGAFLVSERAHHTVASAVGAHSKKLPAQQHRTIQYTTAVHYS